MRRGVLMSMLQQAAVTLPVWSGRSGERFVSLFSPFYFHLIIYLVNFIENLFSIHLHVAARQLHVPDGPCENKY